MTLTEHYAVHPTAAVSGLYFAHPRARYFAVGKIGRDQVESYAARCGMTLAESERWLAPNLGYQPEERPVAVVRPEFGSAQDSIEVADDFDAPLEDFKVYEERAQG